MAQSIEQLQSRLSELKSKRKARSNVPGLANNVKAIDAEIARIEAEIEALT